MRVFRAWIAASGGRVVQIKCQTSIAARASDRGAQRLVLAAAHPLRRAPVGRQAEPRDRAERTAGVVLAYSIHWAGNFPASRRSSCRTLRM